MFLFLTLRFRSAARNGAILLCALLCTILPARAQTNAEPSQIPNIVSQASSDESQATNPVRSITLRECIDLALARGLGAQIARLGPEIARYELKAYYGIYDPTLTLGISRDYIDQPANFDPKKLGTSRIDQEYEETYDRVGPSLDGRLPFGLRYDFYAHTDHDDALSVPLQLRTNNYYSLAGVNFRQPLLKDFWIDADRRNIKLARSNLKISEWQLRSQLINAVTDVKQSYFNLILAHEEINVARLQVDRVERLASDVHKRVEAHGLSPLEEPRVQSELELARTALFGAEQNYVTQIDTLWNLISDDYTNQVNIQLLPADTLVFVDDSEPRPVLHQTALASRPDLWEMRLTLEKQDVILSYDKNQRLPDLSLKAGYGRQSVQPEFGMTLDELGSGAHELYSIGAALSFPIGNVNARNRLKADRAAKERLVLNYRKLQQDSLVAVDSAANALESAAKQIASSRRAREFAELALDAENKLFEAGRSTTFLVLERQAALAQARLVELRALAKFNVARSDLEKAEGVSLEKNGITLNLQP